MNLATVRALGGLATALALALASGSALAQERHGHGRSAGDHGMRAQPLHFDQRFHHNHYYPPRGAVMPVLPGGSIGLRFGGHPFWFHAGVWYQPFGGRFVVAVPPIGIVVPLLPPAYATLWIGGLPYYYANGAYYTPATGQPGYVVVAPPAGVDAAQPAAPPPPPVKPAPDPVIYPRNGQTAQQQEADMQDCNRWATTQPSAMADASVFQRAVSACMDGRGYTVR